MYYLDIETVYILLKIESTNQCHTEYIRNSIVGKNCPTCKLQYIQQTFSPVWSSEEELFGGGRVKEGISVLAN
jgi:hypothetical protein